MAQMFEITLLSSSGSCNWFSHPLYWFLFIRENNKTNFLSSQTIGGSGSYVIHWKSKILMGAFFGPLSSPRWCLHVEDAENGAGPQGSLCWLLLNSRSLQSSPGLISMLHQPLSVLYNVWSVLSKVRAWKSGHRIPHPCWHCQMWTVWVLAISSILFCA